MNSNSMIPIPKSHALLIECWKMAEENLRKLIEKKYWGFGEEFITQLFFGELRESIDKANEAREFENAFLSDLQNYFLYSEFCQKADIDNALESIADGIVGSASLYSKNTEGRITAADLGLLAIYPSITILPGENCFRIKHEHRRGLLCQAKLKKCKGSWGELTDNQEKLIPERISYFSLLLYEHSENDRVLEPFYWKICREYSLEEIKDWLKSDTFPKKITSAKVLQEIFDENIGTDDQHIIDNRITPYTPSCLEIKVGWLPDKQPSAETSVDLYIDQSIDIEI